MSTTLPLFWDLSSPSKTARLDASAKLIGALEHFHAQHASQVGKSNEQEAQRRKGTNNGDGLDTLNAQDVSYSIRRLIRGLASPRESSRLGFAVALTELLSRIDTVTCSQIISLILDSSSTQGSMSGQEERDMLFARLFGLTSVIHSGLLLRESPISTSASSSSPAATLATFEDVLAHLVALGEKKSWLRESAWWAIGLAADALSDSGVSWKDEAVESLFTVVVGETKSWTPEKLALTLKLQRRYPSRDWRKLLSPTFKHDGLLDTGNLSVIARILKESSMDEEEESDVPKSGSWKPQIHFVWDMLLDELLPTPQSGCEAKESFPEFFRIVVDESLFASTSSPERKYWGFQVFQKALPRVTSTQVAMLFTKNFMRSWINHLSASDRYLHRAARQVATDMQAIVKSNPTLGFALILQLTGVNGSQRFDQLTKTKTVETILTSMDADGIRNYIQYLFQQVNSEPGATVDVQAINARRAWIIDQLAALVRNGAIPKSDEWVQTILDWLIVHGLFLVAKPSKSSTYEALRSMPSPPFADALRKACRERLLSCLAELTGQSTIVKDGDKSTKLPAVASNGEFWVERAFRTIEKLEEDTDHLKLLDEVDEEERQLRTKARQVARHLETVSDHQREAAKGAALLLWATLLHRYCVDDEVDTENLEGSIDAASRMFPHESKSKNKKKARKSLNEGVGKDEGETAKPVDIFVDIIIGFLEQATSYMRVIANQVFSLISGFVEESTIDLILTQLERRDPADLAADDDDTEMGDEDDSASAGSEEDKSDSSDSEESNVDVDEEEDIELRNKIEEALRINGVEASTGDTDDESDEEVMDDDQMLAIDEQLAAAFRARATERKLGKDVDAQREATHFKNRVLDLLEIFLKKQPTSPWSIKTIIPLLDLVTGTSPDEKQLADKATGVLRSRIGKAKEPLTNLDIVQATEVLTEVHSRARRAASSDILATLSQCSLYMSRVLHHANDDTPVIECYRQSLSDFITRKASKLNSNFFQDLVRRHPGIAWGLRDDFLQAIGKAINTYRECQACQILQSLVAHLPAIDDRREEIRVFMPLLSRVVHDVISNACDPSSTLTTAQVKDILKLALAAARQTKRVAVSTEEPTQAWDPSSWTILANRLASSTRFKGSTGLQAMCRQIAQMTAPAPSDKAAETTATKRKASAVIEEVAEPPATKKARQKKAKKI